MKKLPLPHGNQTIVDNDVYVWASKYRWRISSQGYVCRETGWKKSEKRKMLLLHRLVNETPEGKVTDHINQNTLDNRRQNLRTASKSVNAHNSSRVPSHNRSGVKGVSWFKPHGMWRARIRIRGAEQSRYFHAFEEAVGARKEMEREVLS